MENQQNENQQQPRKAKRRKKRRSSRPETLSRSVEITAFRATVRLYAVHHKSDEPFIEGKPWLELSGKATEAVKGVTEVRFSLYPEDDVRVGTSRPAACGSIIQAKPELHAVISWPQREYDRLWSLALAGHLKFAYIAFTQPHYNSALVVSASFGNELEEEAD
jgi:hypothetical protein